MSSRSKDYDISYKVLLIGESGVGKTSLIKSYSKPNETFTPSLLSTVGIDFANVITIVDGVRVRLQIWDTAGQERFRTLTSLHFRGTKGILLVYDITNIGSFDQLQYWVNAMNKNGEKNLPNQNDDLPHNYRGRLLRNEQCKSMREYRWRDRVDVDSSENKSAACVPEGPTLRSALPYHKVPNMNQSYVVNLEMLTTALEECMNCHEGPLDLRNSCNVRNEGVCPVMKVKCARCDHINILRPAEHHRTGKRGPPTFDVNSRAGLGALHSGIGHAHYSGLLSTIGISSLSSSNFKNRERESGKAVEEVARESCQRFNDEEKRLSSTGEEEVVKVGVSYDMGWRKRGRSHDSSSGVGTAVGLQTGKVISYATRNTICRVCAEAQKKNQEPVAHDCRKNHQGSSKSMETNVAVELFSGALSSGVAYTTYVGDDDSATESHLKTLVTYDIEKWSDINHASRALGTRLYAAKGKVKGLTPNIISYIQRCFTYCVNQNKGQPLLLMEGFSAIVPHAFGDHNKCSASWCGYKKDPKGYKHGDLPGGKDLKGEDLRAVLEDALQPFMSEESAKKLAPGGSSQRNECVNSVVGSKAPKIRHYGGSESSDFRTAAGIAQFNEGHSYVTLAAEKMGLSGMSVTEEYTRKMESQRKRNAERKTTKEFKRVRRNSRKKRNLRKNSVEAREGVTYQSGIGLQQTDKNYVVTNATMTDLKASLTKEEFQGFTEPLPKLNNGTIPELPTSPHNYLFLSMDLETTGLERKSEILQISCSPSNVETESFSENLFPERQIINQAATQVHGISVDFRNGRKTLMRRGTELAAVSQTQGLTDFCSYLEHYSHSARIVLIAHNGDKFDFPVLINALERNNLLRVFLSINLLLVDSLKIVSKEMKQKDSPLQSCKSKSLSDLYECLIKETFDAHDAAEDAAALSRVLFQSPLKVTPEKFIENSSPAAAFVEEMKFSQEARARKTTLHQLPVSEGMKEKLGKAGLDLTTMEDVYRRGGAKALLAVIGLPEAFEEIGDKANINQSEVEDSFQLASDWIKSVLKNHDLMYEEVVIVGNKSDFEKRRWQVDTQAGQEFARQLGLKFYETSAKTKENVQEVFEELAKSMKYANHPNLVLDGDHGDFDFVDGFTLRSYDFPERAKNSHNCCKVK